MQMILTTILTLAAFSRGIITSLLVLLVSGFLNSSSKDIWLLQLILRTGFTELPGKVSWLNYDCEMGLEKRFTPISAFVDE